MTGLSPTHRAALLGIARGAILDRLGIAPTPALPRAGPLAEPSGAFVSVHVAGDLRGCIGSLRPAGSLAETVARMAAAAAGEDPRFLPVRPDEVGELEVFVSVVSAPYRLDDRRAVEVGTHGLVVKRGWNRGALLPRVAVEHGWGGEEFLRHACLKAGLPANAWEEPETDVEVFEAEEFGEAVAP